MKKILTHGHCSARWKWPTWPDFLSYYVADTQIINLAKPGISNQSLAREVVNAVQKFKDISKVYVMWGAPYRHDIFLSDKKTIKKDKDTWSMWDKDFQWTVLYNGNVHTKNAKSLDRIITLESILYTQMFLDKKNIDYTMMTYDHRTMPTNVQLSRAESELKKQIDFTRFRFYNEKYGLRDFAESLYPDQFENTSDHNPFPHPLPFAHYKWVKDIIFSSEKEIPEKIQLKYAHWKSLRLPDEKWVKDASKIHEWNDNE